MTAPLRTEQHDSAAEPWRPPTARERLQILNRSRTIAIVGASSNPARASHFVATYLLSSSTDFVVWFVNPRESSILGHQVYPALARTPRGPGHRGRLPSSGGAFGRSGRCSRGRSSHVLGPARTLERRGCGTGPRSRALGGDEPLHQDRARPFRGWLAPCRLRYRGHQLQAARPPSFVCSGMTMSRSDAGTPQWKLVDEGWGRKAVDFATLSEPQQLPRVPVRTPPTRGRRR